MSLSLALGLSPVMGGRGAIGGVPAFDPASLFTGGKVGAFYDIATASSLFSDRSATPSTPASVNGPVGTIKDLSGGNNHLIATSDLVRGTLRSGGGLFWIEPVASCQYDLTTISVASAQTSLFAFNRPAAGGDSLAFSSTGGGDYSWWWFSDNLVYERMGGTDSAGAGSSSATGNFAGTTIRNASISILRRNAVQIGTRAAPAVSGGLNGISKSGGSFSTALIYALLVIDTELTGTDLASSETWFGARAGLSI